MGACEAGKAGCIGRYTRGNRDYRWITRLFYAMAHLLSAGNGAAWNRLGTSIFVSDEYNPQILYTGQTCNRLLEPTRATLNTLLSSQDTSYSPIRHRREIIMRQGCIYAPAKIPAKRETISSTARGAYHWRRPTTLSCYSSCAQVCVQ